MLHAGLDLSRKKLDVCLLSDEGEHLDQLAVPPDVDSLRTLARRIEEVHARAGLRGDRVDDRRPDRPRHARAGGLGGRDRRRPEGQGPRAAGLQDRQDRLDGAGGALASATWCRRSGCPIRGSARSASSPAFAFTWSSTSRRSRTAIHSTLINFGRPCPVTDLFGVEGRRLLERLEVPEPWRGNVTASLVLIDDLERPDRRGQPAAASKATPTTPTSRCSMSAPGIGWVLAFTIAAEIGEIERFASPQKLTGYTGLCPRVNQSGERSPRAA